jgi:U3 small nucleolar RNA-associated protein 14
MAKAKNPKGKKGKKGKGKKIRETPEEKAAREEAERLAKEEQDRKDEEARRNGVISKRLRRIQMNDDTVDTIDLPCKFYAVPMLFASTHLLCLRSSSGCRQP